MTEGDPGAESEKPPTTSLVDRNSGTRWASRLAVQFDVGELCFRLGLLYVAEKPFQRLFFFGNSGAMVGLWSSLNFPDAVFWCSCSQRGRGKKTA